MRALLPAAVGEPDFDFPKGVRREAELAMLIELTSGAGDKAQCTF